MNNTKIPPKPPDIINDISIWFTEDVRQFNELLDFPSEESYTHPHIFKCKDKEILFESYKLKNQFNLSNIDLINNINLNIEEEKQKLINKKNKLIEKAKNNNNLQKQKEYETKYKKKIDNIDNIIKSRIFELRLTDTQKNIINDWINESNKVYNFCVDLYNMDSTIFDKGYMSIKTDIFNKLYGNNKKGAPYDMLTDEIRSFCSNINSCLSNLKNGNINYFKMKYIKPTKKIRSLFISYKSVLENGIYPKLLGELNMNNKINYNNIVNDCRLVYNYNTNKYYLKCPMYYTKINIEERQPIVALDPGEKIFITYYGLNECGKIGEDIRKPILKIEKRIRQLQRIKDHNKNKNNKSIKHKKQLQKRINRKYEKINNKVKELHNQTAIFLCKNYKTIMIPEFETQNMISNNKDLKKKIKNKIEEIKNGQNVKQELKKYSRISRLNGRVKFVLNNLSHYGFRQHLTNKCSEYGCELIKVTEEYTSQICPLCGKAEKTYEGRTKICTNCNYRMNRDISGARSILIKNYSKKIKLRR